MEGKGTADAARGNDCCFSPFLEKSGGCLLAAEAVHGLRENGGKEGEGDRPFIPLVLWALMEIPSLSLP